MQRPSSAARILYGKPATIDRAAAELGTRIDKGNETGQSDLFPDESEVIPFLTVVEAVLDQLAIAVEQLAVHVAGLVERVAPRLVQEAHQREVAPRKPPSHAPGRPRRSARCGTGSADSCR